LSTKKQTILRTFI